MNDRASNPNSIAKSHSLTAIDDKSSVAPIVRLNEGARPANIAGHVVAINVDPVN